MNRLLYEYRFRYYKIFWVFSFNKTVQLNLNLACFGLKAATFNSFLLIGPVRVFYVREVLNNTLLAIETIDISDNARQTRTVLFAMWHLWKPNFSPLNEASLC